MSIGYDISHSFGPVVREPRLLIKCKDTPVRSHVGVSRFKRYVKWSKDLRYLVSLEYRLVMTLNKDDPEYILRTLSVERVGKRWKVTFDANKRVSRENGLGDRIYRHEDWSVLGSPVLEGVEVYEILSGSDSAAAS